MNIKLSPYTESRTRKLHIECESELSFVDKENIRNKQCNNTSGIKNVEFHSLGLLVQSNGKYLRYGVPFGPKLKSKWHLLS